MSADELNIEAELNEMRARMRREVTVPAESAGMTDGTVAFAPGFADRVMARLDRETTASNLADGLRLVFRRLAPLAAAAVLGVGSLNLYSSRMEHLSVTERVLGLPAVTVASALSVNDLLTSWSR